MRILKTKRSALLAVVGVLVVSAAAIAYWTTSGSGTGSGSAGSNTAVTVAVTSSPSGLVPGGDAQAVGITLTNPVTTKQYVTDVVLTITSVAKATGAPAGTCSADDFAVVDPEWTARELDGEEVVELTGATLAMVNAATNQDACKNATVNLKAIAS